MKGASVTRPKNPKALLSGLALAAMLLAGCLPSVSPSGAQGGGRGTTVQPAEPTTTTTVPTPTTTTTAPPLPTTTTTVAPPTPGGFVHPGVLVSEGDIDFVRAKIAAGEQPWKGAYD